MSISVNERAKALADRLADDADALRVAVRTLDGGARVIDCGSGVPGGLEAGRRFAEITMGGLGSVTFAPVVLDGRSLPGLTVVTDHPALACLGAQYAGWQIKRDDYFAMASGPGRALIRAEDLYDDLDVDERASVAVLALETRDEPPADLAANVAERAGVAPGDLTLLYAPTASLAGGVQVAARIVETALHKLHEIDFDVKRVVSGYGTCPLPPVSADDGKAIGRTNDAVLYGGRVELTVDASDEELEGIVERVPASSSSDFGEPFGKVLEDAEWDFYKIDPLLFSPAEVSLVSVQTGRSFHAGGVRLDVLERSFGG
jgi:methenyltetrahydromethanopterin cyclohydrolase